jgi:hypothetical protein
VAWTTGFTAIAISIGSLILSAGGLLYTHASKKRELLVKLYDELLQVDRQRGRQLLFEWCETGRRSDWPAEDMQKANHALAWFELVSYMHDKRHISRKDSFAIWGVTAVRTHKSAEQSGFLEFRNDQHGRDIWPHFAKFVRSAEKRGVVGAAPSPTNPPIA